MDRIDRKILAFLERDAVVDLALPDMDAFQAASERLFSEDKNVAPFQSMFVLERHRESFHIACSLTLARWP